MTGAGDCSTRLGRFLDSRLAATHVCVDHHRVSRSQPEFEERALSRNKRSEERPSARLRNKKGLAVWSGGHQDAQEQQTQGEDEEAS